MVDLDRRSLRRILKTHRNAGHHLPHHPEHLFGTQSYTTGKLAVSREGAKRLLRSVIAQPTTQQKASSERRESVGRDQRRGSVQRSEESTPNLGTEGEMRSGFRGSVGGPVSGMVSRPNLTESIRTQSDVPRTQNGTPSASVPIPGMDLDQKPVATAAGVSVSLNLAEPVLFLQGFEQNDTSSGNTAMLRGTLHLRVLKSSKIKAVTLKFKGRAVTKWPEGRLFLYHFQ